MKKIDLLSVLVQAGIDRLKDGKREISGSCPAHFQRTGKPDRHPSWSINKFSLLHFCQSCGYKGTLTQLLRDVTGSAPEDLEDSLRVQDFVRRVEGVRDDPASALEPITPVLTEFMLQHVLHEVPNRVLELRNLQRSAIDAYGVRYDRSTKQVVMPVRDESGQLLGAQYRNSGSVLTLPEGMAKSTTLYGYSLMQAHDEVALVESPLDCSRMFGVGIPTVASLGAWVSQDQCRLLARAFSVVYLALDNDKAGQEGAEFAAAQLRKMGCATVPWSYTNLRDEDGHRAKDPGDAATDDMLVESWHRTRRWGL